MDVIGCQASKCASSLGGVFIRDGVRRTFVKQRGVQD